MVIGVIPDLHGSPIWKDIIKENEDVYKWIFLGDYCDSFTYPDDPIYFNLEEIIKFKEKDPKKVVLLLGNHDIHYLFSPAYQATGYRWRMSRKLQPLFQKNKHLFTYIHQEDQFLFSHAGISKKWLRFYESKLKEPQNRKLDDLFSIEKNGLVTSINRAADCHLQRHVFSIGPKRGGLGIGGPLWADISEVIDDPIDNYWQVVGHTEVKDIQENTIANTEGKTRITFVDCLMHQPKKIMKINVD